LRYDGYELQPSARRAIASQPGRTVRPDNDLAHEAVMDRRSFLRLAATGVAAGAGAAAVGAGWTTLGEPNWPVLEQIDVTLPRLPARLDGLRVAQLSDLHVSQYTTASDIGRAAALAMRQSPDLIALTGDFIWREVWQYADR